MWTKRAISVSESVSVRNDEKTRDDRRVWIRRPKLVDFSETASDGFGGNEIINATTAAAAASNVYLSLCPMDENANVENEASMSDATERGAKQAWPSWTRRKRASS